MTDESTLTTDYQGIAFNHPNLAGQHHYRFEESSEHIQQG